MEADLVDLLVSGEEEWVKDDRDLMMEFGRRTDVWPEAFGFLRRGDGILDEDHFEYALNASGVTDGALALMALGQTIRVVE